MKVDNPKISKKIKLISGGELEVQINEDLVEKIKEEYGISEIDDHYIQIFFRDVLHDAGVKEQQV